MHANLGYINPSLAAQPYRLACLHFSQNQQQKELQLIVMHVVVARNKMRSRGWLLFPLLLFFLAPVAAQVPDWDINITYNTGLHAIFSAVEYSSLVDGNVGNEPDQYSNSGAITPQAFYDVSFYAAPTSGAGGTAIQSQTMGASFQVSDRVLLTKFRYARSPGQTTAKLVLWRLTSGCSRPQLEPCSFQEGKSTSELLLLISWCRSVERWSRMIPSWCMAHCYSPDRF